MCWTMQAPVVSYLYDDFGDVTESKASGYSGFENELQYTGAVYDELTGLLYLNARYYISPSNELCELQTDLCKKRPNLDLVSFTADLAWQTLCFGRPNPIQRCGIVGRSPVKSAGAMLRGTQAANPQEGKHVDVQPDWMDFVV